MCGEQSATARQRSVTTDPTPRELFTSYRALAKAKRNHVTTIQQKPDLHHTDTSTRIATHPCQRPASATSGPEYREWKYHSNAFVDPKKSSPPNEFTSLSSLDHEKRLHKIAIPVSEQYQPPAPPDPEKPRFDSWWELSLKKKYHATPLFPTRHASTRSNSTPASSSRPAASPPPPPTASPEPRKDSHEQLCVDKYKHIRDFNPATPPPAREVSTTPDGLFQSRHDLDMQKRVHRTPIRHRPHEGPTPSPARSMTPPPTAVSAPPRSKPAPKKAAGRVVERTSPAIFAMDGLNYPPTHTDPPAYLRDDGFKHISHDRLHLEKQVSATPLFPLPQPPPPPTPPDSLATSQRRFRQDKQKHIRGIVTSPRRSPSALSTMSSPPSYVGIRWNQPYATPLSTTA